MPLDRDELIKLLDDLERVTLGTPEAEALLNKLEKEMEIDNE